MINFNYFAEKRIRHYSKLLDNIDDIVKIENFEKAYNDNFRGWHLHHRYGVKYDVRWLKSHNCYFNRPYYEFMFLTSKEHLKIHKDAKNTVIRYETVREKTRRMFIELTGLKPEENPFYFKNLSKKHRKNLKNPA